MKTPYFVLHQEKLKKNYLEFERLCKKHFKDYGVSYSVKTNSLPEIIKVFGAEDYGFEVASLKEINFIKDYKKNLVVFNGPCKTEEELKIAVEKGFLINIDSFSEIDKISNINKGKIVKAGLRVSIKKSKFGFSEENLDKAINYAKEKNIKIMGLHFHSGTKKDLKEYSNDLKEFSKIVSKRKLEYLDFGGGFPDRFQLKNLGINLEDYFLEIKKYFGGLDVKFIFEPGRNLVSDCMDLITKVEVIKENFGETYAILDAGINILSKITISNYNFVPLKNTGKKKTYVLAGPLLFSNDILGKINADLSEGDLIKVENVGAYCYNLAWEISYDKPKVLIE